MASQPESIEIVIQQLNQFNPDKGSVGHFLDESAKIFQVYDATNETFLMETLSGCLEYKPLLDIVVNAFYIRDGKHCLLSEHNVYVAICYLAIFQLDELGLQRFSSIVKSLDAAKICKFLRFFFNVMNLSTWIKDEWSQIYDSVYVKDNWIEPLLRWQPKIQELIVQLAGKPTTATTSKTTEPKEFNLTVPNPRAILIPVPISSLGKIKPLPETTYKPPRLKQHLQEINLKNRRQAEDLLLQANIKQFSCAVPRPDHTHTITNDTPKYTKRFQAQKITGKTENAPIKLNATAILREGVLYQRKVEQELNRIEHLLRGAKDPSKFLEWQKQMCEQDLDQQLAKAECRRLQAKLNYEEAILARQNFIQENQKSAEQNREEKAKMRHQYKERNHLEEKERKKLVQQMVEGRKAVKQARMRLQKCKHQIVQEVSEQSQKFLLQTLEKEEEQLKKRCELIQQLRAIEYLPGHKNKFVDLTQTGDHGVLGEMSVVELQERLALLSEAQKKAEEEKRDQIIQDKLTKEQLLVAKLEQISMFRAAFGRTAALKQERKKQKPQFSKDVLKDKQVLELQQKIAEKSMERKLQAEYLKTASLKNNERSEKSWTPQKVSLQDEHWKKLEESRQQQSKMLQRDFMSREVAQRMLEVEAQRAGTTACIVRSTFLDHTNAPLLT